MSKRPVVLVVMDGVGISDKDYGNAVNNAYTPTLHELKATSPNTAIKAHGLAVGLPSDGDMGNSEVGHNALGCGQIYSQGAKLVNESIESKDIFKTDTWKALVDKCKDHGKMHFIGLLSDGNVHSHINHLMALIEQAKADGIKEVRVHALLDGRDVPETSALIYLDQIEAFFNTVNDDHFHACIASGGGRMKITMDRYQANWPMVEAGWHTHVLGEGRQFASAKEAVETYRSETGVIDQDLPAFVIAKDGKPVGTIEDGDSVVLFNFRGDRAQEISLAFDSEVFTEFDRVRKPDVMYAGMLQYDGDLKIPNNFLVYPPKIKHTLSEYLVKNNIRSYAISETQKYGHVTYFWNGNNSQKFSEELEDWVEIKSDVVPFEQRPWMKSAEITDTLVEAIESGKYDFLRTNFPNGDMVGHTGNYEATIIGVEAVDLCLERIMKAVKKVNGILIVTADHGNADEMYEKPKKEGDKPKAKTSHTLNKVPFIIYNKDVEIAEGDFGLANVASTVAKLLELEPDSHWLPAIIK
ncbi:2,3-bisphosphoglycerate-independent phosphoglycerate mutase [Dielma fastidiosa]|uniref:2,3-bisphosphoglycerate-independent phosphoglycerate mutase n=1 Tax=Dielma fastidiosa TaxID=1034346 RepID=A0A318KS59_9FIRM|nr:2,3-bisphosphoglycerate-independent phosphoglycerate mutase [Dielma fastidiosa]MDY5169302.1 2,3-bisphosphoglycerate-independent phosphoglycerate mutase [Dielma fastidiosa]PXX78555.1 phosphoglycerate mutase [Dielma fastidiosa]